MRQRKTNFQKNNISKIRKFLTLLLMLIMMATLTPSMLPAYAEDETDGAVITETASEEAAVPAEKDESAEEFTAEMLEDEGQQTELTAMPQQFDDENGTDSSEDSEEPVPGEPMQIFEGETESVKPETDIAEPEELFNGYLKNKAFGSRIRKAAGDRLKGANKGIYNYLNKEIAKVAAGNRSSTRFEYTAQEVFGEKNYWTAAELGLSRLTYSNGEITISAMRACQDMSAVLDALMADNPYALYWFDKTHISTFASLDYMLTVNEEGEEVLAVTGEGCLNLPVARSYSFSKDICTYVFDKDIGKSASAVVKNAQAIVDKYESVGDEARLVSYANEICKLVSFNKSAVKDGVDYGDPWQLIWVFDGDASTNVVCEGYAKAFKFLCDLTDFKGNIECITVTGEIPQGGHMWNIVTADNGCNYLVDVTNYDGGSTGLIMNNAPDVDAYPTYRFGSIIYTYDERCMKVFCRNELLIPGDGSGHTPKEGSEAEKHILVKVEAVPATCTTDGNIEYFRCTDCEMLFQDEDCQEEINFQETAAEALGHTKPVYIKARNSTSQTTGLKAHYECGRCHVFLDRNGNILSEQQIENLIIAKKNHNYNHTYNYKKKTTDRKGQKSETTSSRIVTDNDAYSNAGYGEIDRNAFLYKGDEAENLLKGIFIKVYADLFRECEYTVRRNTKKYTPERA